MAKSGWQQREYPVPLIDPDRCDGCGLCVRACLNGALAIRGYRATIIRQKACGYAGLCAMICPNGAIELPVEIIVLDTANDLHETKAQGNRAQGIKMASYQLNPTRST